MGREEIAAFLGRLVQAAEEGPQAAFALARAQVGQFPRCDSLALNVALTLEGVLTMAGREGSAEEREWIQALYRQAAESRDQAVACQAQAMLFGRAMEEGDFAQAEALLDRLPPQPLYDRAQMEARLAQAKGDGDRAGQLLEHQLLQQASGAQTTLLALLELAGREGRRGDLAPLADKAVALGQLLELAPYGGWSVRLQQACLTRDTDAALAALAGLLGSLETPWPGGTSPLCRHLPRKDGAVLGAKLRPGILRELADPDNPTYAFLRSDPRFWDLVGEAPASAVYVRNKEKDCAQCGVRCLNHHLPAEATQQELLALVEDMNRREDVDGILVQLPLPEGLDSRAVLEAIRPEKDVDAFHPENVGRLMLGLPRFLPCTPAGIMALLRAYGISPAGKHCVVVGRSNIVGKPMALLLLAEDATVTVCHSRTPDLAEQCRRADILISAVGRRGLITSDMVKPGAVVVDVAMNRNEEGKLCGDVDFAAVAEKAAYITPVPGGVGPMTRAMLMENTVSASRRRQRKED